MVRIKYFIAGQEEDSLERVVASVDVVAQEEILGFGKLSACFNAYLPKVKIFITS